ncbi:alpha-beta hydrolase superfamily lysophospholipase [Nocardia tenerifensis]|uniref:Monoacylglycerol lipase n=1 Tax=Nocardia tenerifensis TaxID=228006 RepID=A0A318JYP8_9NOCA|nr:alpha/beta hydrolase [Nocardia tenerifensis]PXX62176.1 alpha-beta hydrolase superfamily lysophospholipase [Nocardia tenerifensis]
MTAQPGATGDPEPQPTEAEPSGVVEPRTDTVADTRATTDTEPESGTDADSIGDTRASTVVEPAALPGTAAQPDTGTPGASDPRITTRAGRFDGTGSGIAWRAWLPESPARGVIVLVHGVAEHSGRYVHVGKRLAATGFAVYALDHVGHGKSAGSKANIGSMDGAADNVAAMLDIAGREHPGVPRFLIGHSMGSVVVLHLATRAPLDVAGIVLSAPPLDISAGNPVQRALAPLLSRVAPNLGVLQLDSSQISRDPEVVRAYDNDPLVYRGKLPARTATEILNTTVLIKERLSRLTVPVLALHGTGDAIAAPSSTDLIERGAGSADLTVIRYDGLYHEIFNEPEQDRVLGDVVDWLEAHVTGK